LVFALPLSLGTPACDQFFTIIGQIISNDRAQSAFVAGLKLGGPAAADAREGKEAGSAGGVINQMVPSLIHSFIEATRQIKSHPTYSSFDSNPHLNTAAKAPLFKSKPKQPKQSALERSMTDMRFPASKVQLAMRLNPGLTDVADQRHWNGLMEDDDAELRALEEEQNGGSNELVLCWRLRRRLRCSQ
jgi:hypothetical protein